MTTKEIFHISKLPKNFVYVPLCRQATNYTCGVTALQSVMAYHGVEYRDDKICERTKPDPQEGTRYQNLTSFAEAEGFAVKIHKEMKLSELKLLLDSGVPVIVLLQAWADENTNYQVDWDDGHYAVACGYDENRIYFMDPSTLGNYTYIPTPEFEKRWHDTDGIEKLFNFGMILTKNGEKHHREHVVMME